VQEVVLQEERAERGARDEDVDAAQARVRVRVLHIKGSDDSAPVGERPVVRVVLRLLCVLV
jgi:hypothetical protein